MNDEVNNATQKPRITLTYPCKVQLDEALEDIHFSLSLPITTLEKSKDLTSKIDDIKIEENESLKRWFTVFEESIEKYIEGNSFIKSLEREKSDWRQEVVCNDNEKLRISAISNRVTNSNISNENALFLINKSLELGTVIKIPLWHSGFWVTIKAPSSGLLIAVDRLLASEKIILGRQTNGTIFSGISVYHRKTLMELISECIINTSIKDYTKDMLYDHIKITDYQTLLWGLCCSNHPDGYDLTQSCVVNLNKCTNVLTEKVMLSKLSWVDNSALDDKQKTFMQNQKIANAAIEDIIDYQTNLIEEEEIDLNETISLILKVPNLTEDLKSGTKWVDSLVNMVDKLFRENEITDEIRNIRILEQSKASALRQYSAWIDRVVIKDINGGDNKIFSSREIIDSACDSLTTDSKICKEIFKAIGNYIDDSTISLIGIPSYNCPACQAPQSDEESKYPEIIPLAMDNIFFTLIRQLTELLIVRENTF